jgi:hypothetical protein
MRRAQSTGVSDCATASTLTGGSRGSAKRGRTISGAASVHVGVGSARPATCTMSPAVALSSWCGVMPRRVKMRVTFPSSSFLPTRRRVVTMQGGVRAGRRAAVLESSL